MQSPLMFMRVCLKVRGIAVRALAGLIKVGGIAVRALAGSFEVDDIAVRVHAVLFEGGRYRRSGSCSFV